MTQTHPTGTAPNKTDGQELETILDPRFEAFVRRSRLGAQAALGDNNKKKEQQRRRLERQAARASLKDKIAIGNLAEEVGLTSIPMSGLQLRGALCTIAEAAAVPARLVQFEAAGQAWLDARRPGRDPQRLPAFVTASIVGAQMEEACLGLRLRRVTVPRGFTGKLTVAEMIELGTSFKATIRIVYAGEECVIVDRGSIDQALVERIEAELGGGVASPSVALAGNEAAKKVPVPPSSATAAKPAPGANEPQRPSRPAGGFGAPLQRPASAARQ